MVYYSQTITIFSGTGVAGHKEVHIIASTHRSQGFSTYWMMGCKWATELGEKNKTKKSNIQVFELVNRQQNWCGGGGGGGGWEQRLTFKFLSWRFPDKPSSPIIRTGLLGKKHIIGGSPRSSVFRECSEQISWSVAFGSKSISGVSLMNCTGSPWDQKKKAAKQQTKQTWRSWDEASITTKGQWLWNICSCTLSAQVTVDDKLHAPFINTLYNLTLRMKCSTLGN